jgi:hypothetical protein
MHRVSSTSATAISASAAIGAHARTVQFGQIHIVGEAADVVGVALQQQRVADADHHVLQLDRRLLVAPVHRQRIDAIAPPQPQLAQRAADQQAAGRDQRLHRLAVLLRQPVHRAQRLGAAQVDQVGDGAAQHHPVPGLKRHRAQRAAQRLVAAQHVDHPHAVALEQRRLQRLLTDHRRVLRDRDLGHELHRLALAQTVGQRAPVRQQPPPEQRQVDQARQRHRQPDAGDLEHAERRHARAPRHAVHQKVGRGADHGAHPAKYRSIGQRDQ